MHFGTAGAAVHIVDPVTLEYRDSTAQDLYDAARLTQNLDNVHFFQRAMVCRDVVDNYDMDINTLYACLVGNDEACGHHPSATPRHVEGCFDLLHMVAGGEEAWRARPFVSNSNCFVVPPMKFAEESCITMEKCIRAGMPMLLLERGAGGGDRARADCAGHRAGDGGVSGGRGLCQRDPARRARDLRHLALRERPADGGHVGRVSAEQALLTAGCAQMHRFYNLPGGAASGISDSKLPDMQAGWEQMVTNVLAGLSGLNMCYEAVGMHASLLGFCLESLVLGDDILGQVLRCVRGIDVTEDSTSIEAMKQVCLGGPGHYLGSEQTLALMQTEYIYPTVGNRMSPKEWVEAGQAAVA